MGGATVKGWEGKGDNDVLFLSKLLLGRAGISCGLGVRERKPTISIVLVWSSKYGKGMAERSKLKAEDLNDLGEIRDSAVVFRHGSAREAP